MPLLIALYLTAIVAANLLVAAFGAQRPCPQRGRVAQRQAS